jgi:5-methylcytosine-specific restriction protein A
MPSSPTGLCKDCGSRAVANGYCAKHQVSNEAALRSKTHDRYRDANDPIRKLYKTARWQGTREIVLRRDILCVSCGHKVATEVDHILSARLVIDNYGLAEFYNPERLQGLCHECHSSKTALECGFTGRKGTKLTNLGDRRNMTVVCGPAGSGKTTFVANTKAPNDLTWDYDVVMHDLTGLPMHQGLQGAVGSVLAHRDQWIQATEYSANHCWLIVSNPKAAIVKLLEEAGAKVIVMDTSAVECANRLQRRFNEANTNI